MGSDEKWANGNGCFDFVLVPAAVIAFLLAFVRPRRRRG